MRCVEDVGFVSFIWYFIYYIWLVVGVRAIVLAKTMVFKQQSFSL